MAIFSLNNEKIHNPSLSQHQLSGQFNHFTCNGSASPHWRCFLPDLQALSYFTGASTTNRNSCGCGNSHKLPGACFRAMKYSWRDFLKSRYLWPSNLFWAYFENWQEATHDYTASSHSPFLAFIFLANYFPQIFLCEGSSILYSRSPFCLRAREFWKVDVVDSWRQKRYITLRTQQRDKSQQSQVAAREIPVGYKGKKSCHASGLRSDRLHRNVV